jgi:hypothetical protein
MLREVRAGKPARLYSMVGCRPEQGWKDSCRVVRRFMFWGRGGQNTHIHTYTCNVRVNGLDRCILLLLLLLLLQWEP